ncbi:MAG: patatin-like phospholipase family protein [Steroidobacteraceae bacterium]
MSAATLATTRALLLGAMATLTGCASLGPELPTVTADEAYLEVRPGIRTLDADGRFEVLPSSVVAQRLQARLGNQRISILALSSGGATGAFGAGALAGLTRSATRPEFSVVTGVSAGALLAPLAFLGPQWDAEMTAIYTGDATHDLLRRHVLAGLFGSSVYSGAPLRRLIERYADERLIAAVAAQSARGRLLLVATTEFATGEPVIWDLSSVALNGGPDATRLFRSILLASASVPGMFPPVLIRVRTADGPRDELHVDGGVTVPFFVAPAPQDLPPSGVASQPPLVRIIIDGRLRDFPYTAHANAYSIFRRSVSAGLNNMTRTTLEWAVEASRRRGISIEYAAIPPSYPLLQDAFDFNPEGQRALFEYASSCAQAGRLWINAPSVEPVRAGEQHPASASATCPADDRFIGQFAALEP